MTIGLIGPGHLERCGVRDYVMTLHRALQKSCRVHYADYASACADKDLQTCNAVLLHYESSLVKSAALLKRLNRQLPGRLFVVPHEVYSEDPFAFPYAQLRGKFWIDLKIRQAIYHWRHSSFYREKRLQRAGYHAHRAIPLSNVNQTVLQKAGCANLAAIVPHAFYPPPKNQAGAREVLLEQLNIQLPKGTGIGGVFGFVSSSNDYDAVLSAFRLASGSLSLIITGGEKSAGAAGHKLRDEIRTCGLQRRVLHTGFLAEKKLPAFFSLCDFFICPFRFRSNTGSLLRLIDLGKPILAAGIPITRELKSFGAPIYIYNSAIELRELLEKLQSHTLRPLSNRYPFDFARVAGMYLDRMRLI